MVSLAHCLIGPPGSGKSTVAQQWQAADPTLVIINPDRIRAELYGDSAHQGHWPEIEAQVRQAMQLAIANGQSFIYDATNIRRAWRQSVLQPHFLQPQSPPLPWLAWVMPTRLTQCLIWNQSRGSSTDGGSSRQVPAHIIHDYWKTLQAEPVHVSEGFISVNTVPQIEGCWHIEGLIAIANETQKALATHAQTMGLQAITQAQF